MNAPVISPCTLEHLKMLLNHHRTRPDMVTRAALQSTAIAHACGLSSDPAVRKELEEIFWKDPFNKPNMFYHELIEGYTMANNKEGLFDLLCNPHPKAIVQPNLHLLEFLENNNEQAFVMLFESMQESTPTSAFQKTNGYEAGTWANHVLVHNPNSNMQACVEGSKALSFLYDHPHVDGLEALEKFDKWWSKSVILKESLLVWANLDRYYVEMEDLPELNKEALALKQALAIHSEVSKPERGQAPKKI